MGHPLAHVKAATTECLESTQLTESSCIDIEHGHTLLDSQLYFSILPIIEILSMRSESPEMVSKQGPVQLTPSMIPTSPNFDVKDSQFFRKWSQLPSPEQVRTQAEAQRLAKICHNPRMLNICKDVFRPGCDPKPLPVVFDNMGGDVPVPEVYGWRVDGDEVFIYMEHIQGQTLEQLWGTLEPDDCVSICNELRTIHGDLHRSNIIATGSKPYRILAIVDWEQSGWLPAYWEARKAQFTADTNEKWSKEYLPMILDPYTSTWDPWGYYIMAMGA
ncbi:hypothetical protein AJ80_05540 [Polytolypa hystricis UAMH7299]|uniref:Aminoglycoside phosphotransferase domain-containing protein n=1 Tax=Polytolypa hystricis (strain UAMH7299) TaxID=1447883 RepID=A0A2B7Y3C2_POLH7|nr:hypothetical protein AJ80_05540 [Polytolypa hystricis UAMH7299]